MSDAIILLPERLGPHHDTGQFQNGKHPTLDAWLKERALISEGLSARTYVICAPPARVVGYYTLSTAMEERQALPSAKLRRNMPLRIPLLLVGRLAVDVSVQGRGLGGDLLADAIRRCCAASEIAGIRAIVAHAIDEEAVRFYQHYGFMLSPLGERVMLLPIETAKAAMCG